MRAARVAGFAALVLSVSSGLPLAAVAHADGVDLFVNSAPTAGCSDTAEAAGSQAAPFCTVSAAAAVVRPGQTVHIGAGSYPEEVRIDRSGTPEQPITFTGPSGSRPTVKGLTLVGVHDVSVRQLLVSAAGKGVAVSGAERVVLDSLVVSAPADAAVPAVHIGDRSTGVTLSRTIVSSRGDGIVVDGGTTDTVITTNAVRTVPKRGIALANAPRTVVTANSVGALCGPALELSGGSSGAAIENNVLGPYPFGPPTCPALNPVSLSVSADSAEGTSADYNVVTDKAGRPYAWAGTPYDGPLFRTATGQGAHDIAWFGPAWIGAQPSSPLIDAADADARGQLTTDLLGRPRVDDPLVADTGHGAGHHDRGAFELQDALSVSLSVSQLTDGGNPQAVEATGSVDSPWFANPTLSLDFGDGTAPVTASAFPLRHAYAGPGTYTVTVTATDQGGATAKRTADVTVAEPGPLVPRLTVGRLDTPPAMGDEPLTLRVGASAEGTVSPWAVESTVFDYGDGTPATRVTEHVYAKPGTYPVTMSVTDIAGRKQSASGTVTVGSAFVPMQPTRILDTRRGTDGFLRADETRRLQVAGIGGVPADGRVTAVLLNLTATDAVGGGYVTAWDGGTPRPTVSSLNLAPLNTVANGVVVPVAPDGTIAFYNHSEGVQLIADIGGYYTTKGFGSYLSTVAPTRVLDTRYGTGAPAGKLGPGGTLRFKVRGAAGVPETASAVTLNLTATEQTTGGYVTAAPVSVPPTTSSINFPAGRTVANQVTVPIAADGTVTLYNFSGEVHLIADVQAFYGPVSAGLSPFVQATPARLLDTRTGGRALGPGGTVRVKVTGAAGVPEGARSVLVNLTAVRPTAGGFLTAYAAGTPRPATSVVNFTADTIVPNLAFVPVSADGWIEIYNHTGTTDAVVDLQGYTR